MDEPLEKNFVEQMRDTLQKQLSEFETAQKKQQHDARIVADVGAKRWRELKDSLERLVEEINEGLPEGMLSFPRTGNDNEFSLLHELSKRKMDVTFNPSSAIISYQGASGNGRFLPRVEEDALKYHWDDTTPCGLAKPTRRITFENQAPRRVSTTLRHMRPEFIEFCFLSWAVC
jgi:hypothetical protein